MNKINLLCETFNILSLFLFRMYSIIIMTSATRKAMKTVMPTAHTVNIKIVKDESLSSPVVGASDDADIIKH